MVREFDRGGFRGRRSSTLRCSALGGSTRRAKVVRLQNAGMAEQPTPAPPREDDLQVVERARTKPPRRYQVVLHNDDYTTMEFVVEVLMRFFHKDITQARHIMLHVHHKGYGVVDTFPRDVAETKAEQVMDFAREHGHPLRCTAEPEAEDGPDD
jgi:ATP-dependent Clp protease adaptor protein ClpS